jgi:hypothetical protein
MPGISQNHSKNEAFEQAGNGQARGFMTVSCKGAQELINTDLFGAWVLDLQVSPSTVLSSRLELFRNPDWAESLAGHFMLQGKKHEVFGDVEGGSLEFDETDNGKDIRAIWKGRIAEGSCNAAILGTRRDVATNLEQPFVMRRSGW